MEQLKERHNEEATTFKRATQRKSEIYT